MSAKFMSALRRVFEPIFGRRWRAVLLAVPVVVVWPIAVFYRTVAFDSSDFVEEWIKLSVTTFIFYFLVEVVQERKRVELSRQDFASFFEEHVLTELRVGLQKLEDIQRNLTPGAVQDTSDELLAAARHVEHVSGALASAVALRPDLSYAAAAFGNARAQVLDALATIADLAKTRYWGEPPLDDLTSAVASLREAQITLSNLKGLK